MRNRAQQPSIDHVERRLLPSGQTTLPAAERNRLFLQARWTFMKTHWLGSLLLVALLFALLPGAVFADYGEAFLLVRCDTAEDTFEIEPLIIWNEQLDALRPDLDKGLGRVERLEGIYISVELVKSIEESCEVDKHRWIVRVRDIFDPVLEFYDGERQAAAFKIEDVWQGFGSLYRARYGRMKGWEEVCGKNDVEKDWHTLDRTRNTTNC